MSQAVPRLPSDECARRGREIYQRQVASQIGEGHDGQVVAIDVESGAFEIAPDTLSAADQLTRRVPDAQIWFARVGQGTLHRIRDYLTRHDEVAMVAS